MAVRYREGVDAAAAQRTLRSEVPSLEHVASCGPKRLEIVSTSEDVASTLAQRLAKNSSVEKTYPVYVAHDGARMVPTDDIIVCVDDAITLDSLGPQLDAFGLTVVGPLPVDTGTIFLLRAGAAAKEDALGLSRKLEELPGVKWAEPDFAREIFFDFTPDDPLFSMQQNLNNTGANGATSDADVDAPEGWNLTTGSASIVIAIIDDGVDTSHTDLRIAAGGYDFYNSDSDPSTTGTDGHGTGCAGIAAAIINNGKRVAGIAGGCSILPIKISEGGGFATNVTIGNAIRYAADRADVLSNSWGGGGSSSYINSAIDYAVTKGRGGKGSPVFFASGNSASGWYQGGSRYRLSTAGLNGSYYFGFTYDKDASSSSGLDAIYIDNVCLLKSDGYTHQWRQDFEGSTFPPSGWALASGSGSNYWYRTSTNAYKATGGSWCACSGPIGDSQWTILLTPLQTITGAETLAFAAWVSTEANKDLFYVSVYDASLNYVGAWGPFSGTPTITTAVAYPANYTNSIAVGAASDCDRRADYSEYGSQLDFLAPSNGGWNDITTLDPTGATGWTADDYKVNFGGTSAACPLAAGIAALRLSYDPDQTASSLRSWMRAHCDKIGELSYSGGESGAGGRNDEYGYGRLNTMLTVPVLLTGITIE
jgi:subtilisin family serine protease